jgi:hypothetical protein
VSLCRPASRHTQPPVQWMPGLFPGLKRPGSDPDHPPPLAPGSDIGRAIGLRLPPLSACLECDGMVYLKERSKVGFIISAWNSSS